MPPQQVGTRWWLNLHRDECDVHLRRRLEHMFKGRKCTCSVEAEKVKEILGKERRPRPTLLPSGKRQAEGGQNNKSSQIPTPGLFPMIV